MVLVSVLSLPYQQVIVYLSIVLLYLYHLMWLLMMM